MRSRDHPAYIPRAVQRLVRWMVGEHLIRRSELIVQDRPSWTVRWADIPQLSASDGRCPAAWQQCWQQSLRADIAVAGVLVVCGYVQAEVRLLGCGGGIRQAVRDRLLVCRHRRSRRSERDWLAVVLLQVEEARTIPGGPLQGGPGGTAGASALGGAVQGALSALGTQAGGLQQTGGMGGQTSLNGDSDNSSSGNSSGTGNGTGNSNSPGSSSSGFNGPTFGGGPILGVASTSKAKTIRVFADKTHYNDWLFIYLSQFDVGGLLVGPVNPNQPPAANLNGPTAGQPGVGMPQGIGGLGQGQMPNSGFTQGFSQQQNSGQTLPNQTPPQQ